MLAADSLIEALGETEEETITYKNNNDDHDFGEVLQFCSGNELHGHEIRCSDGQIRIFSFD